MNLGVAARTWRAFRRSLSHAVESSLSDRAVALLAQHVHIRHVEHPRILRAVRAMATEAADALHRGVLEHEWPAHVCMALGADAILIHGGPQIVAAEGSVSIMAIRALHCPFGYGVMEGHGELRFHIGMAALAKLWLRGRQQMLRCRGMVHAVTADAAKTCLGVWRAHKVGMCGCMTSQAALVDRLRSSVGKGKYFVDIAATLHVGLPRPVAVFTGQALVSMQKNHLGVRIIREGMGYIGMTCLAHLRTNITGWKCGILLGLPRLDCGNCWPGSRRYGWVLEQQESEDDHECGQQGNSSH